MTATTFEAHDPATGEVLERYQDADDATIDSACRLAAEALPALADARKRIDLLRTAAGRLRDAAEALHAVCTRETALPRARLESELERTCVQLELFASVVEEGSYVEAIIDPADPAAPVAPRPDVRRMLLALGPVAVFGASNFPYAFSVAGGDTASALAAGCPVVVKAHPSHPGTSERVAAELVAAVRDAGLPEGTFAMVHGQSSRVGRRLVQADEIEAVGFTGSLAGGRALLDIAAARPRPIPVYAEMGSVNPVVITSAALRERGGAIADGLLASVIGGTGQFCTKPGVVLVPDDDGGTGFVAEVARRLDEVAAGPLLNARIHEALRSAVGALREDPDLQRVTAGRGPGDGNGDGTGDGDRDGDGDESAGGYLCAPIAYEVSAETVTRRPELLEERFGPFALFVRCPDTESAVAVLDALGGQLTATLHAQPEELESLRALVARLEQKAGRVIFDGFPTGVAVTHAMHHGGPYPATSAPLYTSVGSTAIRRFLRPVAWQNAPATLLPEALRDENPLGIWRVVDGRLTQSALDGPRAA
jgi:alpha-ketoglutaric semialdehyde dehydrogenase